MTEIRNVRGLWLRRLLKVHASALFISLGVYFVFASLDPGLFSYDMRAKFRALADDTITITATVLDSPVQPVVTALADCDESSGTLQINLDWGDDINSFTYDIDRDSAPLVSGLAASAYSDTLVALATTYEYRVTANGPMDPGSAVSLPVSVTTPALCEVTAPAPAVTIVSFAGRNIDSYQGTPRVSNRRPIFSGTTSMANAVILVTIGNSFIAEFTANSNGYWEWKPPYGVSSGSHIFTVTATDPNESVRQAIASLRFDILKQDDEGSSSKTKDAVSGSLGTGVPSAVVTIPLSFTLSTEPVVLQGERLQTKIVIETLREKYAYLDIPIRYSVTDMDGRVVFTETRPVYLMPEAVFEEAFDIPLYMLAGKYVLEAEILLDTLSISRRASFLVEELPLIRLSSGGTISYADIIRQLGWVVFLSLFLFFLWLALFIREFALYLQGDGEVTEYDLKKAGYFRR
jgi:hypothetical protein